MRVAALTVAASLFAVLACQDLSTTPANSDLVPQSEGTYSGDNPPPPPIDSGAVGISGWLKFDKDEFDNTSVDNSAAIRYSAGVYSGRGTIRINSTGGTYVIDLSKVNYTDGAVSFSDCAVETTSFTTDGRVGTCYDAVLTGAGVNFVDEKGTSTAASLTLRAAPKDTDSCSVERGDICTIDSQ
jgi:hypothetical protein